MNIFDVFFNEGSLLLFLQPIFFMDESYSEGHVDGGRFVAADINSN